MFVTGVRGMTDDTGQQRFLELLVVAGIAAVKQQERIEREKKPKDRTVTEEDHHRAARKLADYVDATVRSIQPDIHEGQMSALNWPPAAEASNHVLKVMSWIAKGDIAVEDVETVGLNLEVIDWRHFDIREVASGFPDD
jgi:hypothetical protein